MRICKNTDRNKDALRVGIPKKAKKIVQPAKSIAEINSEALKMHMTYGKYVEYLRRQENEGV